ncbi:MAG: peroxiredoxin family protein [Pirellulaceae bacterium]
MLIHTWPGVASSGRWWRACAVGMMIFAVGCSKSDPGTEAASQPKYEVADEGSSGKVAQPTAPVLPPGDRGKTPTSPPATSKNATSGGLAKQPPSIPGEQLDAVNVPEGTPEELMAFLNQLGEKMMGLQVQIQSGQASPSALQPVFEAMLSASEKILAADVDLEMRKRAIDYKAGALTMLSRLSPERPWSNQIQEFAKSLSADPEPSISIEGRIILLGLLVGEISRGASQDVEGLLTQLKAMLADEARNASVLNIAQQSSMALRNMGRENEALEAFKLTADAFQDHPDPQLAAEAENMREQLFLLDLDVDLKLNEVVLKREGAEAALMDALTQLLQRPKPGIVALEKVLDIIPMLEQSGNYAMAIQVCELTQAAYKDNPTAEIRTYAQERTDVALRRLNLLGKPLAVEGTLLNGSPLDFAPYQGKVVLLAFWSSMSPPCRPELLAVKSVYEKYHAKGFEVIGVCLDQDLAAASRFLDELKLPWVTITNNKLTEQFGVEVIPYLVLTDAQGTVADLFLRAAALEAKLAALLGEPDSAPAASPPPNS